MQSVVGMFFTIPQSDTMKFGDVVHDAFEMKSFEQRFFWYLVEGQYPRPIGQALKCLHPPFLPQINGWA